MLDMSWATGELDVLGGVDYAPASNVAAKRQWFIRVPGRQRDGTSSSCMLALAMRARRPAGRFVFGAKAYYSSRLN